MHSRFQDLGGLHSFEFFNSGIECLSISYKIRIPYIHTPSNPQAPKDELNTFSFMIVYWTQDPTSMTLSMSKFVQKFLWYWCWPFLIGNPRHPHSEELSSWKYPNQTRNYYLFLLDIRRHTVFKKFLQEFFLSLLEAWLVVLVWYC